MSTEPPDGDEIADEIRETFEICDDCGGVLAPGTGDSHCCRGGGALTPVGATTQRERERRREADGRSSSTTVYTRTSTSLDATAYHEDGGCHLVTDADDHRFGDLDPSDVFVELIQQNPEVCSNCFIKLRDVWFPHATALSKRGKHTATWRSLVRYYIAKPDRVEAANVETASNQPKACANCGSIRGSTMRPLPTERAVEYAWNLSRTLAGFGVDHNPLLLAFVVAHRKRFPEFGSRDDDTYRVATSYAIDETSPSIEDVLVPGPEDPARTSTSPIADPPALPAPDDPEV